MTAGVGVTLSTGSFRGRIRNGNFFRRSDEKSGIRLKALFQSRLTCDLEGLFFEHLLDSSAELLIHFVITAFDRLQNQIGPDEFVGGFR